MKRFLGWALGSLLAVGVAAEAGLRLAGVLDFPIYEVGPQIGYIPAPNQQGNYLNRNHWMVNERSLETTAWQPHGRRDLLLVGDSLVWGGNLYDHPHKLGPQLERALRGRRREFKVWPASAGSWGILNEIAYLELYPDVVQAADFIVWVVNAEDFGGRSVWQSEATHPRQRPRSAAVYVFAKFLLPKMVGSRSEPPARAAPEAGTLAKLRGTLQVLRQQSPQRPIVFVFYPTRSEMQNPGRPSPAEETLRATIAGLAAMTAVRADPRWSVALYQTDRLHPSPHGYEVLSAMIAESVEAALASSASHPSTK